MGQEVDEFCLQTLAVDGLIRNEVIRISNLQAAVKNRTKSYPKPIHT